MNEMYFGFLEPDVMTNIQKGEGAGDEAAWTGIPPGFRPGGLEEAGEQEDEKPCAVEKLVELGVEEGRRNRSERQLEERRRKTFKWFSLSCDWTAEGRLYRWLEAESLHIKHKKGRGGWKMSSVSSIVPQQFITVNDISLDLSFLCWMQPTLNICYRLWVDAYYKHTQLICLYVVCNTQV